MALSEKNVQRISRREFLHTSSLGALAAAAALGMPWAMEHLAAMSPAPGEKKEMKYRPLGKTGHRSSLLCFGGVALAKATPAEADWAVGYVLEHGVNHIDVAPSYGEAELRLGEALGARRKQVFLACKTGKRTRAEAAAELRESLRRLRTDHVDLYQFHALDTLEDLDKITGPGGAGEAFLEAKEQGLVRFLGITGHRPATQLEALRRMKLDTIMCPVNFIEEHHSRAAAPLLEYARQHGIGAMAIKAISSGPWPPGEHSYQTWYRPFDDPEKIHRALSFTLSQSVATAASAGDLKLLKLLVSAAERFVPLSAEELKSLLASGASCKPLFPKA
jgi:predicted aldo/keto reductase-like oxidoreductase